MEAAALEKTIDDIRYGRGELRVYRRSLNHLITLLVITPGVAFVVQKGVPPIGAGLVFLLMLWWLGLERIFYRKTPFVTFMNKGVNVLGFPLIPWRDIEGMAFDVRRHKSTKMKSLILYVPSIREFVLRPSLIKKFEYYLLRVRGERRIEIPLTYVDIEAEHLYQVIERLWRDVSSRKEKVLAWTPYLSDDEYEARKEFYEKLDDAWEKVDAKREADRFELDEEFNRALESGEFKGLLTRVMARTQQTDKMLAQIEEMLDQYRTATEARRHQARVRFGIIVIAMMVGLSLLIVLLELR